MRRDSHDAEALGPPLAINSSGAIRAGKPGSNRGVRSASNTLSKSEIVRPQDPPLHQPDSGGNDIFQKDLSLSSNMEHSRKGGSQPSPSASTGRSVQIRNTLSLEKKKKLEFLTMFSHPKRLGDGSDPFRRYQYIYHEFLIATLSLVDEEGNNRVAINIHALNSCLETYLCITKHIITIL